MAKHVTEQGGALFEVQYEPAQQQEGPLFQSIHILDRDYRPVGPNLIEMMDNLFVLTGVEEGTKFLSLVADELVLPKAA